MVLQWEECCGEYRSKRALYFRMHQEMQDANIKLKGLQQVRSFIHVVNLCCIFTIFDDMFAFPGFSAVKLINIDGWSEDLRS